MATMVTAVLSRMILRRTAVASFLCSVLLLVARAPAQGKGRVGDVLPSAYLHQTVGCLPRSVVIMPSRALDTHFDEAATEIS